MVAAVVCIAFDQGMSYTRHLGCDGGVGLALQVGIIGIPPDISLELPPEAVLPLTNGNGSGEPVGVAEPRVAPFGELVAAPALAALAGGKVKATELQVLNFRYWR